MKRSHRNAHLVIWLILGPAIIAILILALQSRPADPTNETLPQVLLEDAR